MRNALFAVLAMVCLCDSAHAQQDALECADSQLQSAEVAATVRSLFEGFEANDAQRLRALLAPSFQLYEVNLYDTAGLIELISGSHAKGVKPRWSLSELRAHAGCGRGWAKWQDQATFTESGMAKTKLFLESAVLHRENGRWLIDFMHSTPLTNAGPQPTGPTPQGRY